MHKNVYIRADGSPEIGLGHLVRCMALAQMLKGEFHIHFVSKAIPLSIREDIIDHDFSVKEINFEEDFLSLLTGDEIVVLDHYDLDSNYQKKIKDLGCKLVCIDDLHDKFFYADLIINHSPGIKPKDYQTQEYTLFGLGLDFALLRPPFLEAAKQNKQVEKIENLFICFGGSDSKNLTERCLKIALSTNKFKKILVVVGPSYKNVDVVKDISTENHEVDLFHAVDAATMLHLMKISHLAIVPSSGVLLEALSAGCKVISGMYARNQEFIYSYYKNSDVVIDAKEFGANDIKKAIEIGFNKEQGKIPGVDGLSGKRIKKLFLNLLLDLRKIDEGDCKMLYEWANDPGVRGQAFTSKVIQWEDHLKWFKIKLNNPASHIFILEKNALPVGQIRFDKENDYWKIDYSIDRKYRGMGLGTHIIELGLKRMKGTIKAWVKEGNTASCKVFENSGFKEEASDDKTIKYSLTK